MNKKRIGLFGGTFNPIHNGHLFIANCSRTCLGLEKVIFIPTHIPPHKDIGDNFETICARHRANMVSLAIQNNRFDLSMVELQCEGSYTIDTLKYFSELLPDVDLFFIMGSDSFGELPTWKSYLDILKYRLVVLSRYTNEFYKWSIAGDRKVCRIYPPVIGDRNEYRRADIIAICQPPINISSTKIREFIKNNLSVRYLLPDTVIDYIDRYNLYKGIKNG